MTSADSLPSAMQKWAHSTCSRELLQNALTDSSITAIEVDILMGHEINKDPDTWGNQKVGPIPIMAHPPAKESDLTMLEFLRLTSVSTESNKKHIKLDFKEMETVKPTIEAIDKLSISCSEDACVFLNADVLPGPAMRNEKLKIDGDDFLSTCLSNSQKKFLFSLGWVTDPRSYEGYTDTDIDAMMQLIEKHDLISKSAGIVFAVNARVLEQNCQPFILLLSSIESSQLLVWTATGEPPISQYKIQKIKDFFEKEGFQDRVGFDCNVETSSIVSFFIDLAVNIAAIQFYLKKYIS